MVLHAAVCEVIARHRPVAISVEQAFVAKDPSAALKLGHARAIALLAAAQAGLDIAEYAPNHIKKCVVGVGHADKTQVMHDGAPPVAHRARRSRRCRRCARRRHRACASGGHARAHRGGDGMIGKLTGIVDSIADDHAILDVNGVGYLVHCPSSTLSRLSVGASVVADDRNQSQRRRDPALWILVRRRTRMVPPVADRAECRRARGAECALRAFSPRELERALALSDKAAIGQAQGVGPKLALRIVTELKDKAPVHDAARP